MALLGTTVIMVLSQVWLSVANREGNVSAIGTGAVSSGRSIKGDLDIDVLDSSTIPSTKVIPSGVHAAGRGSVAAGRNIKGRIRIRSRDK